MQGNTSKPRQKQNEANKRTNGCTYKQPDLPTQRIAETSLDARVFAFLAWSITYCGHDPMCAQVLEHGFLTDWKILLAAEDHRESGDGGGQHHEHQQKQLDHNWKHFLY